MPSERISRFIANDRYRIEQAFRAASTHEGERAFVLLLIELNSAISAKTIVILAKKHRILFRPSPDNNPFIYIGYLPCTELDSTLGTGVGLLAEQCREQSNPQWMIVGTVQSDEIFFQSFPMEDSPPNII